MRRIQSVIQLLPIKCAETRALSGTNAHIWNRRPWFAYSLCNFYGATMVIKSSLLLSAPLLSVFGRKKTPVQHKSFLSPDTQRTVFYVSLKRFSIFSSSSVFNGRPARSAAMPVLFLLSSPKIGFSPRRSSPPYQISRLLGQKCGNTAPKTVKIFEFWS